MNNYNFRTLPFPALISLLVLSDLLYCCSQIINPLSLIPSHPTYCKCVFTNMRKKNNKKRGSEQDTRCLVTTKKMPLLAPNKKMWEKLLVYPHNAF